MEVGEDEGGHGQGVTMGVGNCENGVDGGKKGHASWCRKRSTHVHAGKKGESERGSENVSVTVEQAEGEAESEGEGKHEGKGEGEDACWCCTFGVQMWQESGWRARAKQGGKRVCRAFMSTVHLLPLQTTQRAQHRSLQPEARSTPEQVSYRSLVLPYPPAP